VVVLATANHFFLDVLAGGACILAGYAVVTVVGRALGKTGGTGDGPPVPVLAATATEPRGAHPPLAAVAARSGQLEGGPLAGHGELLQ
jgi:hypothetical protein